MKRFYTLIAVSALTAVIAQNLSAQEFRRFDVAEIDAVVERMTLEEKAQFLNGAISTSQHGWGWVADASDYVVGAAGPTVQYERLGIPRTIFADGPAGLRISPNRKNDTKKYWCTAFPVGTLLASSWDTSLVERVCAAMGDETKHYGVDVLLGPGMNIQRNPLCGRNFEYLSEDPRLSGEIAAAYVRGVQSAGVGACIKHFAANNQETLRDGNDARLDERTLREIYLRTFQIAIEKSDPYLVMTSYNKINGTFCCEDEWLLEDVLRGEWGYRGMVVTDWIGRRNTVAEVEAGNDLLMPGSRQQIQDIVDAVRAGVLSEEAINRNVKRILQYVARTPAYKGYVADNETDLVGHAKIARESAADCMVLLKNETHTLPYAAGTRVALYGLGSYDLICGGTGSGHVNRAYTSQLDSALTEAGYIVDTPLSELYHAYYEYEWKHIYCSSAWVVDGFGFPSIAEMELPTEAIVAREKDTDWAVVTIRRSAGEASDRSLKNDYRLSQGEYKMLEEVCAAYHRSGKRVVVVLNIDAPIDMSWSALPDAILCAWLPGQEGGHALADIISGAVAPSGRLPMTIANRWEDYSSSKNFPVEPLAIPQPFMGFREVIAPPTSGKNIDTTTYEEGVFVGYRHFDTEGLEVAYPFGFGLSYTQFEYSKPRISRRGDVITVECDVRNVGDMAAREVVQLYSVTPECGEAMPCHELRSFHKTRLLLPGETERVVMQVAVSDLAYFSTGLNAWHTPAGVWKFEIGASSRDVRLNASIRLTETIKSLTTKYQPKNF